MEKLGDDCLLLVFKMVNLKDQASLRSVNKRFRALCDTIPIRKLVVFERSLMVSGELFYTGERYGYKDAICCFDLQKLFNSPILRKQMRGLRVLMIHGTRLPATQLDLNVKYDELEYLQLNQVIIISPQILQSSNIKYLILDQVCMKKVDEVNARMSRMFISGPSFANETLSVHTFGFDNLRSKGIKFLRLKGKRPLEFDFFDFCVGNKLFDSLDELDVMIDDLNSLLVPSKRCANLKVINAITSEYDGFFDLIRSTDLPDFFSRIRKDLKIYLFGIEFNQQTTAEAKTFLAKFNEGKMVVNASNLECKINKSLHQAIKKFEEKHDLTRFYRLVSEVFFSDHIKDAAFYKKFVNCETIRFDLDDDPFTRRLPDANMVKYFDYFPNVKCVHVAIHGLREIKLRDSFLNEIPKRMPHLFVLVLDCKNSDVKFDFLFKWKHLISIMLNTAFPFDQSVYIELVRRMKCLFRLDVCYVTASDVNRGQLSAFKKRVIDCLTERKLSDSLEFKIEIYKNGTRSFVRYHMRPIGLPIQLVDEEKMYAWSMTVNLKAQFPNYCFSTIRNPLARQMS